MTRAFLSEIPRLIFTRGVNPRVEFGVQFGPASALSSDMQAVHLCPEAFMFMNFSRKKDSMRSSAWSAAKAVIPMFVLSVESLVSRTNRRATEVGLLSGGLS